MLSVDTSVFGSVLEPSRHITIVLPQNPTFDHISAALGLKVSIEESGRRTRVISPDPVLVEFNRLVGVDTIVDSFGSRDLVITFPSQTEYVDKVSYNLDKGELQLVITPKVDSPELDQNKLKFVSGVSKTDLIVTIGAAKISDFGQIADPAKSLLSATTSLSIQNRPVKEKFTTHEIFDDGASSLSELTTFIIESAGLKLNSDAASNLLAGIEKATNSFRDSNVSVSTFEAAVVLMRKGAKRHFEISASQFPPGSIPGDDGLAKSSPQLTSSLQSGYGADGVDPDISLTKNPKPPADWYEPKIFKGPTLP